jgi:MerR family redox-sensitive transcriptional activator SoxR
VSLAIGEVAERTGLSVSAIRYYDRIGLISAGERIGGKRRFDADTIGRVSFIRRASDVGFTLDETRAILDDASVDWALLVATKRAELMARRERLDAMLSMLDEIAECGCEAVASCAVIIAAE